MAKRKRKSPRRKRTRTLSAGGGGVRRRNTRRRRRGLSENGKGGWVDTAKKTGLGMAGGFGAVIAHKLIIPAATGKVPRVIAALAVGLLATKFGAPSIGSGFTGGLTALTFQNGVLADEADYADQNALSDQPIFLSEDGTVMVLEEGSDGTSFYREVTDDEARALQEAGAFNDYELVS
jgi:hypothetical protein